MPILHICVLLANGYDFSIKVLDGEEVQLETYFRGQYI